MNIMIFGKLIGGVLGWSSAGLVGLIVGVALPFVPPIMQILENVAHEQELRLS